MKKSLRNTLFIIFLVLVNLVSLNVFAAQNVSDVVVKSKNSSIGIIFVVLILLIIYLLKEKIRLQKSYKEINDYHQKVVKKRDALREDVSDLIDKLYQKEVQISKLESWKMDVMAIYPDIQLQLDEFQAKKAAKEFEKIYNVNKEYEIKAENYNIFNGILEVYELLDDSAKKYVSVDIERIKENRKKCAEICTEKVSNSEVS